MWSTRGDKEEQKGLKVKPSRRYYESEIISMLLCADENKNCKALMMT